MRHLKYFTSCCQTIAGDFSTSCRHCAYAVDASPHVQTTISQPCQLLQIFAYAAYADEFAGTNLPRCTRPLRFPATRANKATSPRYDKQLPADRPSLLPSMPDTYLQDTPSKRRPAHCEVILAWAPPHSGKERSSCLKQQDGDVAHAARAQNRATREGSVQNCTNVISDTTCATCSTVQHSGIGSSQGHAIDSCQQTKLQSGGIQMKQSSKHALRTPSGRPPRKQEASGSSRLSTDCTAILHTADSQATGEAFSLHAWCASIAAASSVPTDRLLLQIFMHHERALCKKQLCN